MDQQPQVNPEEQSGMPSQSEGTQQAPTQEEASSSGQTPQKSMGPILGIVIIVILLVLGGFYFWGTQIKDKSQVQEAEITAEDIANQEDTVLDNLNTQSASDEIGDIEADLDATDLESLDSELDAIDLELNFQIKDSF